MLVKRPIPPAPKLGPWRKVARFRRDGPRMTYILDKCQHEVPKPSPDTLDIRCPVCPSEE
jgi:hypothetical protein